MRRLDFSSKKADPQALRVKPADVLASDRSRGLPVGEERGSGYAMGIWKHSTLAAFYHKGVKGECKVRIDGNKIVLSYEQHDGPTVYEGEEVVPGHFKLTCARKGGQATLHRVQGENLIEGYWVEGQNQGMWRIQLKEK